MNAPLPLLSPADVRAALLDHREIALLDVREEHPYAQAHPLWAANLPLARIEFDARRRLPRLDVTIAVFDDGEGLAEPAARQLQRLGYTQVHALAGGLQGWRDAGLELFRDVNVPSKAFGELVEAERHTPSLPADEVKALLDAKADVVVLDARRFDEYRTMDIPGGISVPGAELVLRARALAPDPATRIVVNCAGRTRSLIGAQSLINAGIPNPVAALRNGTIGWTLAGHPLAHGQDRQAEAAHGAGAAETADAAARVARAAGVRRVAVDDIGTLAAPQRTVYRLDVRSEAEFAAGHLPGFMHAPGGQLVQETDHWAPVRGARLLLAGSDRDEGDGVRAEMTASWLAQMGWEVWVVDGITARHRSQTGPAALPPPGPRSGRYRRPYEGTDNPREAMQAYLDWEFGLVAQLARDGTHGFAVLSAAAIAAAG